MSKILAIREALATISDAIEKLEIERNMYFHDSNNLSLKLQGYGKVDAEITESERNMNLQKENTRLTNKVKELEAILPIVKRSANSCACKVTEDDEITEWCLFHGEIRNDNTRLREATQFAVDVIPGDVGSSKTDEAVDKLQAALNTQKEEGR